MKKVMLKSLKNELVGIQSNLLERPIRMESTIGEGVIEEA